jgi:hypothetical protein
VGTTGVVAANRPANMGSGNGYGMIGPNNQDLAMVAVVSVPAEALLLEGSGYEYERQVVAT